MRLVIREEAEQDILAAMTWYAAKRLGLEQEFFMSFDEALVFLSRWPRGGKMVKGDIRSFPLERFPYAVIHSASKDEIVVIRVYHQRRDPKKVLRRSTRLSSKGKR